MPELPEVETVRCQLEPALTGRTFVSVERVEPFMLRDCTEDDLRRLLPGSRVDDVGRLGKFIIVRLARAGGSSTAVAAATTDTSADGGEALYLTLHLGMTGQILVGGPAGEPGSSGPGTCEPTGAHVHTRFLFGVRAGDTSRTCLEFRDARKFGRLHLTVGAPAPRLAGLGPDAWKGDWDTDYLRDRLRGRTAPLKAFLLDQRHLSGIGNIYADEILWWAKLSPLREAGSLGREEVERLAEEIRRRLEEGVRRLGCSLSDFVDTQGRPGSFQEHLQAYRRQGQACSRCGSIMVRTVIGGRGTAYCTICQR